MRIALEATWVQGQPTGVGMYVRGLLSGLAEIDGENEYLLLHSSRSWSGPDLPSRFEPVSYRLGKKSAALAWRLGRVLKRHGADVYHATFTTDVPPRIDVPVCTTVHDLFPLTHGDQCGRLTGWLFRRMLRWTVSNTNLFIANSRFVAREITRILGVGAQRVVTVPLAPCLPPGPHPRETGLDCLLCVGAVEPRKGQLPLLEAYASLVRRGRPMPGLVFAGPDRGDARRLLRRIEELQLGGKVRRLSYVSDRQREELYRNASLFLMPSSYEGFGLPMLEAMSYGLPVVCSDIPPLREIGVGGVVYVEPGNVAQWSEAISSLMGDEARRTTMSRFAVERAGQFTWKACACKTLECYERAVKRRH
ncbi:MAG: glycosyltransferase family 1 protein [Phycisphaerae bacterium]|nr:glycosyltransferase family 1 protein [Phycisphaerae bacterium]